MGSINELVQPKPRNTAILLFRTLYVGLFIKTEKRNASYLAIKRFSGFGRVWFEWWARSVIALGV